MIIPMSSVTNEIQVNPGIITIVGSHAERSMQIVKGDFREKTIRAGTQKLMSVISDSKQRISEMMANDGTLYEEEYDNHHQFFKSEALAEVNLLNDQLCFNNGELDQLRQLNHYVENKPSVVEYGRIVKTDLELFFVFAGIEDFLVDGVSVFGLSINTPLYQAMKGRRTGDTFTYGGFRYRILDIF